MGQGMCTIKCQFSNKVIFMLLGHFWMMHIAHESATADTCNRLFCEHNSHTPV